jgi:hypothetical protein
MGFQRPNDSKDCQHRRQFRFLRYRTAGFDGSARLGPQVLRPAAESPAPMPNIRETFPCFHKYRMFGLRMPGGVRARQICLDFVSFVIALPRASITIGCTATREGAGKLGCELGPPCHVAVRHPSRSNPSTSCKRFRGIAERTLRRVSRPHPSTRVGPRYAARA